MRPELLLFASELARRGEPFVLATVVRREAPHSARVGDSALVTKSGAFHGWVGGSCTQPVVVREALRALDDNGPRLIALSPSPESDTRSGVTPFLMTCHSGGSVDIYLQPVVPAPRLVVFGSSPIGQALVRLGKALGYTVDGVDADADRAAFPEADRLFTQLESAPQRAGEPWLATVVATMGQWDEDGVRAALALDADYLGVVASQKRFSQIRDTLTLTSGDVSEEVLERITNPAGLDIGAKLPEEIALSVLAEIVQLRHAQPAAPAAPPNTRAEPTSFQVIQDALDPICKMRVPIATARHRAEVDGRMYYFCCAGCREEFLREPARYVVAGSSEAGA